MTNKFYLVGGYVRDSFLGVKSKDLDYAVETDSFDSMRELILAKGGEIFLETPSKFTIRANVPGLGATDYVLCRKDGEYLDGRSPETVEIGTIYDDLARRDFRMNAMAIDVDTGAILDPFNGQEDIQYKLISAVGSAEKRINEDKLRALRAVRFAVTKQFSIGSDIVNAILDLKVDDFKATSTERIREELFKMFSCDSKFSIDLLQEFPVLWDLIFKRNIWFKPTVSP